jgi:hypothetical protein
MDIVLVKWFIKPDQTQLDTFLKWWRDGVPQHRSGLFCEFLSEPIPREEITEYVTHDMRAPNGEYAMFVNVGIWRNEASFQSAIHPNDSREPFPFEVKLPVRTVLTPRELHAGSWLLPELEGAIVRDRLLGGSAGTK